MKYGNYVNGFLNIYILCLILSGNFNKTAKLVLTYFIVD